MTFSNQTVNLKLISRPLRMAYLVEGMSDLETAVKLYTHVWGGQAGVILPIPSDEEDMHKLASTLMEVDPDVVFIPHRGELENMINFLEAFPLKIRPIFDDEVNNHCAEEEPIRLVTGTARGGGIEKGCLPHIVSTLETEFTSKTEIDLLTVSDLNSEFKSILLLQSGITTKNYQDILTQYLGAKQIPHPKTYQELFKLNYVLSNKTALDLTMVGINKSMKNSFSSVNFNLKLDLDDSENLCIFLATRKENNIKIASYFWNMRWFFSNNKMFFYQDIFLRNFENYIHLVLRIQPHLKHLNLIFSSINKKKAEEIYNQLKKILNRLSDQRIGLSILYGNLSRYILKNRNYSNSPISSTSFINSDNSIRFSVPTPKSLSERNISNNKNVFGYDIEISVMGKQKIIYPKAKNIANLLSNPDQNNDYQDWCIRATDQGLAGTALSGKESRIYIHPDELVIATYFKSKPGFNLKPNKHTRYALGFINRLGGVNKIFSLVRKEGLEVLTAISSDKASQSGFTYQDIINFMVSKIGYSNKDAKQILKNIFPDLLSTGLVLRGYAFQCPICDLEDWYSITELNEYMSCHGCMEQFQIEKFDKYEFSYKPNELVYRYTKPGGGSSGGIAVLMTAALFRPSILPPLIQFGGDIIPLNKEVDLVAIAGDLLIIAECKDYPRLVKQEQVDQIEKDLEKTLDIAEKIGAHIVLFGNTINRDKSDQSFINQFDKTLNDKEEKARNKRIILMNINPEFVKSHDSMNMNWYKYFSIFPTETTHVRKIGDRKNYFTGKPISLNKDEFEKWYRESLNDSLWKIISRKWEKIYNLLNHF